MQDFYKILQVRRDASMQEIKKAFRTLAKKYHPDKNPNNPKAAEIFKTLNDAYMLLSDVQKRKAYDQKLIEFERQGSSDIFQNEKQPVRNNENAHSAFNFFQTNHTFEDFFGFDMEKGQRKDKPKSSVQPMKNKDVFEKFFGKNRW